MLSYSNERVRILLNSIVPEDGVRPEAVRDAIQREIFWSIPYDRKMRTGTHLGQPIVISNPQSAGARSLTDLATVIGGGRVDQNRKLLGGFKWRANIAQPVVEGN